jgi:hypothetical protein
VWTRRGTSLSLRNSHHHNCWRVYTNKLIVDSTCRFNDVNKKRVQNIVVEYLQLHFKIKYFNCILCRVEAGNVRSLQTSIRVFVYSNRLKASQCNPVPHKACLLGCYFK